MTDEAAGAAAAGAGDGLRAAQCREIAEHVLQVAVGQLRRTVGRHQRVLLVNHFLQVGLQVALQALARVHDLNAEHVLGFLHAADALTVLCHERHRFKGRRHPLRWRPNLTRERSARTLRADPRKIGSDPTARAADPMARGALLREQLLTVLGVADRRFRRGHAAEISEIRDDLQNVVVRHVQALRGHLGAGDAFADRVEEPLVGRAAGDERHEIRAAIAARIEPVAVAAAHAIGRHAGPNRVLVSQVRVVGGGMRRHLSLRDEQAARHETQRSQQRSTREGHRSLHSYALTICGISVPYTSVSRMSRPLNRYVSFVWSSPSRCSIVACRSWYEIGCSRALRPNSSLDPIT